MKQLYVVNFELVIISLFSFPSGFSEILFVTHTRKDCVETNISVLPGSMGHQSQCEDGRGVQGVI